MATMSDALHHYAEAKIAKAAEILEDARSAIPVPGEYTNFDDALGVIADCRAAVTSSRDVDAVARSLRTAVAELGQLCGGPAEAGVNAAIGLLDQAIGGETM